MDAAWPDGETVHRRPPNRELFSRRPPAAGNAPRLPFPDNDLPAGIISGIELAPS